MKLFLFSGQYTQAHCNLSLSLPSFTAYSQEPADCIFNTTITGTNQTVVVPPGVVCFTCDFGRGVANNASFKINLLFVPSSDGILVIPDSRETFPQKQPPHNVLCITSFGETMNLAAAVYIDGAQVVTL